MPSSETDAEQAHTLRAKDEQRRSWQGHEVGKSWLFPSPSSIHIY